MNLHPAALMLPPMSDNEFAALKADIQEHGLRVPVVELKGQIVDGRHRARACEELGIDLLATELPKDEDPFAWVISANLHRRHLTKNQKAMVAARVAEALKPAAHQRMRKSGGRGKKKGEVNLPDVNSPSENGRARDQAAALLGVSGKTVSDAMTVLTKGSAQLVRMVDAGEVSVSKAAKVAREHEKAEQVEVINTKPNRASVDDYLERISKWVLKGMDKWNQRERASVRAALMTMAGQI